MTASELVVIIAAFVLIIGFTALIVVLLRVLDTVRDLRREVVDLRSETRPLLDDLRTTTHEARSTVDEARTDLERFDKVLGSAEAIGDAVGGRIARTTFSSPAIKAAGLAKGTSRFWARLRGGASPRALGQSVPGTMIDVNDRPQSERRRRRA